MEKIKYNARVGFVGSLESELLKKQNEMINWINKHERQRSERLDIIEDYVNALVQDYNRRHKTKEKI